MNRNALYVALGILLAVIVVVGYQAYQARQTSGISIDVGKSGVNIQTK